MGKSTFLSIDLDYWSEDFKDVGMIPMLESIIELDVPIHCVVYHHELTPIINSISGLDTLINVDYHSDFADLRPNELTLSNFCEGTWINYVNFAHRGMFQWVYPCDRSYEGFGTCHSDYNPFNVRVNRVEHTCWDVSKRRMGGKNVLKHTELCDVKEIGISISPDWNTMPNNLDALAFLSKHKLLPRAQYKDLIEIFSYDEKIQSAYFELDKEDANLSVYRKLHL